MNKNILLLIFLFAIIGFACKTNSIAKSEKQTTPSTPPVIPATPVDCEAFLEAFYKHFSQKDSSLVKIEYQDSTYILYDWISKERRDCLKGLLVDLVVKKIGNNYTSSIKKRKHPFYCYKYPKGEEPRHTYNLVVEAYSQNIINEVNWGSVSSPGRRHFELRLAAY